MSSLPSSAGSAAFMHARQEEQQQVEEVVEAPKQPLITSVPAASHLTVVAEEPLAFVEDRREPTMGWPLYWWNIRKSIKSTARPPKRLSKKEEAQIAYEEEQMRIAEREARKAHVRRSSEQEMRNLSDEMPSFNAAFIGVKGAAGTTTTMVNATTMLADITRTTVYAGDFNPASGSAGNRLGKDWNQTISLREFGELVTAIERDAERADELEERAQEIPYSRIRQRAAEVERLTKSAVNSRVRPTEYGVRVLIADDYTLETTEQFGTRTSKILTVLEENCDYLMLDTANDITTAASMAVLKKADVLVFTANVAVPDSLRMLYTSMEKVRQLAIREPSLLQKVKNSVVVITNIPEGVDLEVYKMYLNRVNISNEITQVINPGDFQGPFMGVYHDPEIALDGQVHPDRYKWETKQAYINIVIALFEQAIRTKKK